jgi:hypothetical protein
VEADEKVSGFACSCTREVHDECPNIRDHKQLICGREAYSFRTPKSWLSGHVPNNQMILMRFEYVTDAMNVCNQFIFYSTNELLHRASSGLAAAESVTPIAEGHSAIAMGNWTPLATGRADVGRFRSAALVTSAADRRSSAASDDDAHRGTVHARLLRRKVPHIAPRANTATALKTALHCGDDAARSTSLGRAKATRVAVRARPFAIGRACVKRRCRLA